MSMARLDPSLCCGRSGRLGGRCSVHGGDCAQPAHFGHQARRAPLQHVSRGMEGAGPVHLWFRSQAVLSGLPSVVSFLGASVQKNIQRYQRRTVEETFENPQHVSGSDLGMTNRRASTLQFLNAARVLLSGDVPLHPTLSSKVSWRSHCKFLV